MTASAPEGSSAANRNLVRARPELMRLADFACGRWLAGTDSPQLAYGIDRLQARARLLLAQEQLLKEGEPQDALLVGGNACTSLSSCST